MERKDLKDRLVNPELQAKEESPEIMVSKEDLEDQVKEDMLVPMEELELLEHQVERENPVMQEVMVCMV